MTLRGGEQPAALWLDAEDASVHQGLAWALDHDPPLALRLAVALSPWWAMRGRWGYGSDLLQRAVAQTGPEASAWHTGHLWLGQLKKNAVGYHAALNHYSKVVDALRDGPPCPDLVDGLIRRAEGLALSTKFESARADADWALDLARRIGYATGEAMALAELSVISHYVGDDERAVHLARQAQRIDPDRMTGRCARYIGRLLPFMLVSNGHLDNLQDSVAQALARAREAGDLLEEIETLYLMVLLARKTGRVGDARAYLRETLDTGARADYMRLRLPDILDEAAFYCAATGKHAAAVTLWSAREPQTDASGIADLPADERERTLPLQQAVAALLPGQAQAAQERGRAMTPATAVEFVIMMTGENARLPTAPSGAGRLSARERQLVTMVAQGQTDAQIAGQLFISVSTVRTHLDRIRDKSGCRRRADLTRLALQQGII